MASACSLLLAYTLTRMCPLVSPQPYLQGCFLASCLRNVLLAYHAPQTLCTCVHAARRLGLA